MFGVGTDGYIKKGKLREIEELKQARLLIPVDDYTCLGAESREVQGGRRAVRGIDCAKDLAGQWPPKIEKERWSDPTHLGRDTTSLLPLHFRSCGLVDGA